MGPVRRIVVRDKHPVVDGEILRRPLNRAVLLAAAAALALQALAIEQEIWGAGGSPGPFGPAPFAVVAFVWLALGLLVFLQRRARYAGQMFLLAAAAGSVFLALAPIRRSPAESFVFAAGLLLLPAFLVTFVRMFDEARRWRWRELWLFAPALVLVWPVGDALYRSDVASPVWRIGLGLVGLYLAAAIAQAGLDMFATRSPSTADQLRALLIGLVAGTLISIPIFLIPVVISGQKVAVTWLPATVLLFLLAVGYSVLQRELEEVDFYLRRSIVYGVMTLGVVAAYAVLGVVLASGRTTVAAVGGGLGFVAVAVGVGAAFDPARRGAQQLIDWLVYGERVDRWDLLQALSERLGMVMSPGDLGAALVREVGEALSASSAFLLTKSGERFGVSQEMLRDEDRRGVLGRRIEVGEVEAGMGFPPGPIVLTHARPLVPAGRETVPRPYLWMQRMHVSLAFPLETRSGLEAVFCLRAKRTHEGFSAADLGLLLPLMRQAAGALDTSLLFAQLEDKVDELRAAYRRIAGEQEIERARLASELHDGIAQELANLITLATVAERQIDADGAEAQSTLARLRVSAEEAYGEVRRVSHALRPVLLDDYGLEPSLRRFVESFQAASGIEVELDAGEINGLTGAQELALFRVAQECLENIRKHSGVRRASMRLAREDGRVILRVNDEGRGLNPDGQKGLGFVGMRERVEAVGGSLHIVSARGHGTCVEAALPLDAR
jgi:signal transduction histidine kinase